jgi:hypothetical protein
MRGTMALKATLRQIAATTLLFGLGACSGPPWTMSKSPDAIVMRWYPDETSMAAADQRAALHCWSWGKTAQLASDDRSGSAEEAQYRCR